MCSSLNLLLFICVTHLCLQTSFHSLGSAGAGHQLHRDLEFFDTAKPGVPRMPFGLRCASEDDAQRKPNGATPVD